MERLQIRSVRWWVGSTKDVRSSGQQLLLPVGDLRGMDTELLSQLGERLVAFEDGQGDLRLEGGSVIPFRPLHCLAPLCGHHSMAFVKPGYPLPHCGNSGAPSLLRGNSRILWNLLNACGALRGMVLAQKVQRVNGWLVAHSPKSAKAPDGDRAECIYENRSVIL